MEELELGPNGGLVYCMEYLLDNLDWLKDELDKFDEDEYIIFDCPGQVLKMFWVLIFCVHNAIQKSNVDKVHDRVKSTLARHIVRSPWL